MVISGLSKKHYRDSGKPRYVILNIEELILKATENKF
jgi:hypothetical protein